MASRALLSAAPFAGSFSSMEANRQRSPTPLSQRRIAAACRNSSAERGSSGCMPASSHQSGLEDLQAPRELLLGDGQRRQQADDIGVQAAPEQQETLLARLRDRARDHLRRRRLALAVAHDLEREHRAEAADLADG